MVMVSYLFVEGKSHGPMLSRVSSPYPASLIRCRLVGLLSSSSSLLLLITDSQHHEVLALLSATKLLAPARPSCQLRTCLPMSSPAPVATPTPSQSSQMHQLHRHSIIGCLVNPKGLGSGCSLHIPLPFHAYELISGTNCYYSPFDLLCICITRPRYMSIACSAEVLVVCLTIFRGRRPDRESIGFGASSEKRCECDESVMRVR